MRRLRRWLLVSLVVGGLSGCGTPRLPQERIVGAWRNDVQKPCKALLMRFAADGVGRHRDGRTFTYRIGTANGRPTLELVDATGVMSYGLAFVSDTQLDLYFRDETDVFVTLYRENEARC